jgi:iron complex transport system ATP-binding protein
LKKSLWGTLSQGERQKILICRALMARFEVLILDEPCAGLDPVAREQFLSWMSEISTWPEAPSLVMVTHHVEEIPAACTHVLAVRGGRVAAAGPVGEVLRSAEMSRVFGCRAEVGGGPGRWWLRGVG